MEPITQREQIRQAVEQFSGASLTDAEAEAIALEMPIMAHVVATGARGVTDFLSGLPGHLLDLLLYLAREHCALVDADDPAGWDSEFLLLTLALYCVETGDFDPTDEALAERAQSLARSVSVEARRRRGEMGAGH